MSKNEIDGGGMSLKLKNLTAWVAMGGELGNRVVLGVRITGADGVVREDWQLVDRKEAAKELTDCPTCDGSGYEYKSEASIAKRPCPGCAGTGKVARKKAAGS